MEIKLFYESPRVKVYGISMSRSILIVSSTDHESFDEDDDIGLDE